MAVHDNVSSELVSPMHAVRHRCAMCRRAFGYRYDGTYRHTALQPIDFICPRCFPDWFLNWEESHDWA